MRFGKRVEWGEEVIRTKFAFFPITINKETRWLERVKVAGHYWKGVSGNIYWEKHRFVD